MSFTELLTSSSKHA